jgi:hypothetical protein
MIKILKFNLSHQHTARYFECNSDIRKQLIFHKIVKELAAHLNKGYDFSYWGNFRVKDLESYLPKVDEFITPASLVLLYLETVLKGYNSPEYTEEKEVELGQELVRFFELCVKYTPMLISIHETESIT